MAIQTYSTNFLFLKSYISSTLQLDNWAINLIVLKKTSTMPF